MISKCFCQCAAGYFRADRIIYYRDNMFSLVSNGGMEAQESAGKKDGSQIKIAMRILKDYAGEMVMSRASRSCFR